jgi:hypothetical protein
MFKGKVFNSNLNLLSTVDKFRQTGNSLVYLFTNARDEPKIAEWVAHHLLLGFDKIYIFDHKSVTPISHILAPMLNDRRINLIRVEMTDGQIKLNLIQRAVQISQKNNVNWMLYLDADEFLLLNQHINVKGFLNVFKFADAIGINWLMFGTSGHKSQPPGLLTENFIRSDKIINQHVKSFVRPEKILLPIVNPHFYNIVNPNRYFAASGNKMTQGPFNPVPKIFIKVMAYIAHYYTQSEEEHIRRKSRIMDDGTGGKMNMYPEIHNVHNEVVNGQLQYKYSARIKAYLSAHGINL